MAGSLKELSEFRLARSSEDLQSARFSYENGNYRLALNRAYYSIFHAIRAVNAFDEFESTKHSGVIAHFNQYHVKSGEFDREISKAIRHLQDMRETADYSDFFVPDEEEALEAIQDASKIFEEIKRFLNAKG